MLFNILNIKVIRYYILLATFGTNIALVEQGISLFGGLFHITSIRQIYHIFIFFFIFFNNKTLLLLLDIFKFVFIGKGSENIPSGSAHVNEDSANENEDSANENEDSANENEDSANENEDSDSENDDNDKTPTNEKGSDMDSDTDTPNHKDISDLQHTLKQVKRAEKGEYIEEKYLKDIKEEFSSFFDEDSGNNTDKEAYEEILEYLQKEIDSTLKSEISLNNVNKKLENLLKDDKSTNEGSSNKNVKQSETSDKPKPSDGLSPLDHVLEKQSIDPIDPTDDID
jgi:hypothetical protein